MQDNEKSEYRKKNKRRQGNIFFLISCEAGQRGKGRHETKYMNVKR